MITFLLGTAGSGKSTEIAHRILKDLRSGKRVILLVPEQMAISAERLVTDLALSQNPPVPTGELEILNFTRLANRVFRTVGGISYQPIGIGGRTLIMYQALAACAPLLGEYRSALVSPENTANLMLSAVQELQIRGITPSKLAEAAKVLSTDHPSLSGKLKDLSLLFEAYRSLLHEKYDDPLDELPHLCKVLHEQNLFSDFHIYFDSFNGLTPQELDVVSLLFQQAENVTFSLCLSPEMKDISAFSSVFDLYHRLCRMAKGYSEVFLPDIHRFSAPALETVCRSLWNRKETNPFATEDTGDAVRLVACRNLYTQAEFVALDIARRVREDGCRYRDFAIVAGDATRYGGVIDSALTRINIPCFFSVRQDMTQIPLIKLILTLFSIKQYGWRDEDVTELLKTGLTMLDEDECDLLESYVDTWSIRGRRWTDDDDWTMHPRGYLSQFTEADSDILCRVNDIRRKLTAPLTIFFESICHGATVRSISASLYRFLCEFGVRERLVAEDSSRAVLIWNTLCSVLDEFVAICGDNEIDAELYARMFSILIRCTDIGRIPATVDEVVIGSASLIRTDGIRHVYLLGANDGEFPATSNENSIFSDSDKIALEGAGIVLSPISTAKSEEGLFHFWRAACSASDSLTVLYPLVTLGGEALKPSLAVSRLLALFPHLEPIHADQIEPMLRINSPDADFSLLSRFSGTPYGEALRRCYESRPAYSARLASLKTPICNTEEQLSSETASILYPGNLSLSQTRIEDYVHCAFGYYCKHVLRLQQSRPALIRPTDTGTFVHHILDRFFRTIRTDTGIRTDLTEEEIDEIADCIIGDYLSGIFGGANAVGEQSSRLLALFRRLKRSTMLVIHSLLEEFKHSSFVPTFFEMSIGFGNEENTVPPLSIPLADGSRAYIVGRIDRVDTFKKGENVYIRVVDYKTGSKTFSVKDLSLGLNMQMLLYLFSIWHNATPAIRKQVGVGEEGELLPAGVLYCPAKPSSLSTDTPLSREEAQGAIVDSLKRSGMLLYDEELLSAMDDTENFQFLPVNFNKDGTPTAQTVRAQALETLEGFGARMRSLSGLVEKIASEIKGGACRILPLREKASQLDACRFCEMKAVCRNFRRFRTPKHRMEGENEHV